MSYLHCATLAVLWITALVSAETGRNNKRVIEGSFVRQDYGIAPKMFAVEAADDTDKAKDIYAEAVKLQTRLNTEVDKLPKVLQESRQKVESAKVAISNARSAAIRHSSATGKSSIAQNAYNSALAQKGIVESGTARAQSVMKVVGRQMDTAKSYFGTDGNPKDEESAKLAASKALANLQVVDMAVEKVNIAAEKTKLEVNNAHRFSEAAIVEASSFISREHATTAQSYIVHAEETVADITSKKDTIEEFARKHSEAQRSRLSGSIEAAKKEMDKANAKLVELKNAAELAGASNRKVDEHRKQFDTEFANKSDKTKELAQKIATETGIVIESEKKGRTAFNGLLDAKKAIDDIAGSFGMEKDKAVILHLLCSALILILNVIASVILI